MQPRILKLHITRCFPLVMHCTNVVLPVKFTNRVTYSNGSECFEYLSGDQSVDYCSLKRCQNKMTPYTLSWPGRIKCSPRTHCVMKRWSWVCPWMRGVVIIWNTCMSITSGNPIYIYIYTTCTWRHFYTAPSQGGSWQWKQNYILLLSDDVWKPKV